MTGVRRAVLTRCGLAIAAASMTMATAGCGGDDHRESSSRPATTPRPAESEAEAEGQRRSSPEHVAYYQLATASGLVRAVAVAASAGQPVRARERALLRDVRRRLRALTRRGQLGALRARLLRGLEHLLSVTPRRNPSRRLARSALATTTAVNAGLRRYGRRHPDVGALVPE
jgi:hypothetical protein